MAMVGIPRDRLQIKAVFPSGVRPVYLSENIQHAREGIPELGEVDALLVGSSGTVVV